MPASERLYLDHAATTPLAADVLAAMMPFLSEHYGNPSSLYTEAKPARKALENSIIQIQNTLGASQDSQILFTSGATEANNWILTTIAGSLTGKGKHLITSQIEHPCVLEPAARLARQGWDVTYLPVDSEGVISPEILAGALRPDTVLVSLMAANNELGTLQPISELGKITREHGALFHTDAVQMAGKSPLVLSELPIDLMSLSAHKFYGPKGVGLLYAHERVTEYLRPLMLGGGQQGNLRSGTENIAGIVGMATALSRSVANLPANMARWNTLQEQLITGIEKLAPTAILNGPRDLSRRLPAIVNFSFAPLEGEALVLKLDLRGVAVSSGSACHSASLTGSHVLKAMGRSEAESKASIRFSLGESSSEETIIQVLTHLQAVLEKAGYSRQSAQPVLH